MATKRSSRAKRARRATGTTGPLPAGRRAPDFTLHSTPDQTVSLSDFRGRPVILAFYPADWSPVCGDQLALYNELLPEFQRHRAELVGVSVDGAWCHAAFAAARHLHFPLLADFEPKGAVARMYGVYNAAEGLDDRALFVVDGEGVIRWSHLSPMGVNPGADGILAALESLGSPGASRETSREPARARAGSAAHGPAVPAPSASVPREPRRPDHGASGEEAR